MDKNYAKILLNETKRNYNLIAMQFSNTRAHAWKELEYLTNYIVAEDSVLDLGCGNGRLIQLLKDKNIKYVGIDNSSELIKIAQEKYPDFNFQIAEALSLPFKDGLFDKVVSIAVLHHIPSKENQLQFLKEAKRVLKLNGFLLLTVWDLKRENYFKYLFNKIFRNSKLDYGDTFIPWGKTATRYAHAFTQKELKDLLNETGLEIQEMGVLNKTKSGFGNLYFIAKKV